VEEFTLRVRRMIDLDRSTFDRLFSLTNSPLRGDHRDDPNMPTGGSSLRDRLESHESGFEPFGPTATAVLAYDGNLLVGWALVKEHLFDDRGNMYDLSTSFLDVYVCPTHRRLGLARALVSRSLEVARISGAARLMVNPWNASSSSFYRSMGFETLKPYSVGRRIRNGQAVMVLVPGLQARLAG